MRLLDFASLGLVPTPLLARHGILDRSSVKDADELLTPNEETGLTPALLKGFIDDRDSREINHANRSFPFIASAKIVDRDGDVILPSAFKHSLKVYKANPVMPWAHDIRFPPIARSADHKITDTTFEATAYFGSTPFATEIFTLYEERILNAFSVGFIPIAIDKDPVMDGQTGITFVKVDLLEISAVVIPANQVALARRGQKHARWLGQAVKSIVGDHVQQTDRLRAAEKVFGLDLDPKGFVAVGSAYADLFAGLHERSFVVEGNGEGENGRIIAEGKIEGSDGLKEGETQVKDAMGPGAEEDLRTLPTAMFGDSVSEDEIGKPYPNEHACRLRSPDKYSEFRRTTRRTGGKVYSIIWGKVKDEDTWEEQAYRYKKAEWSADQARTHCKEHQGAFEAAAESAVELTAVEQKRKPEGASTPTPEPENRRSTEPPPQEGQAETEKEDLPMKIKARVYPVPKTGIEALSTFFNHVGLDAVFETEEALTSCMTDLLGVVQAFSGKDGAGETGKAPPKEMVEAMKKMKGHLSEVGRLMDSMMEMMGNMSTTPTDGKTDVGQTPPAGSEAGDGTEELTEEEQADLVDEAKSQLEEILADSSIPEDEKERLVAEIEATLAGYGVELGPVVA